MPIEPRGDDHERLGHQRDRHVAERQRDHHAAGDPGEQQQPAEPVRQRLARSRSPRQPQFVEHQPGEAARRHPAHQPAGHAGVLVRRSGRRPRACSSPGPAKSRSSWSVPSASNLPPGDDPDPIGHPLGNVEDVGGDDHRLALVDRGAQRVLHRRAPSPRRARSAARRGSAAADRGSARRRARPSASSRARNPRSACRARPTVRAI